MIAHKNSRRASFILLISFAFALIFTQLFLSQWYVAVVFICVPIGTIREEKRKGLVISSNLNKFVSFSFDIHTRNYISYDGLTIAN